MESKDWMIGLATLLAPLFAVQISLWLERRRDEREEKLKIFKTLMATRASTLDPKHVEALSLIDGVFSSATTQEREIRSKWKQYLDHFGDKSYPKESWGTKRVELLVDLLHSMAVFLGFEFDKTHIKNQTYYPEGFGNVQQEQEALRKAVMELLAGRSSLPVKLAD
jgi:hypothetical protein